VDVEQKNENYYVSSKLNFDYVILIRPFLSILYNFEEEINYNLEIIIYIEIRYHNK